MNTATFDVHPSRHHELAPRIVALTKQAAKVDAHIEITTDRRTETHADGSVTVWTVVTVRWEPLVLDGNYSLTAVWENSDAGLIGSAVPGAPTGVLAATKARAESGDCDHCGYTRRRVYTFAVTGADADTLLVGSSCVNDFLGVRPADLLGWLGWERTLDDLAAPAEGDGYGGSTAVAIPVRHALAATVAIVRTHGYTSKARSHEGTPTAELLTTYLFGAGQSASLLREAVGPITDEDVDTATAVVEHFAGDVDESNDYLFTLSMIAEQRDVPVRSAGYLASMPSAYFRATREAAAREAAKPVPTVDGRITVTGEIVSLKWKNSGYGEQCKVVIVAPDGWRVYGTLPAPLVATANVGTTIRFDARVVPSDNDETFGFYRRPTKAAIV